MQHLDFTCKVPRDYSLGELKVIKRYGGDIATAAVSIRKGIWPALSNDETEAIAFIPRADTRTASGTSLIAETVLDLYRLDPENTQVLSARRNGPDGVKTINSLCQAETTAGRKAMTVWSAQHDALALTGFNVGDPVLCTRNMWDRGLQNGSLGIIVEVEDVQRPWLMERTANLSVRLPGSSGTTASVGPS